MPVPNQTPASPTFIPEINPVRDNTEAIPQYLIAPGSQGLHFESRLGPRIVYLDQALDYPEQPSEGTTIAEKLRQAAIWGQLDTVPGAFIFDPAESRPGGLSESAIENLIAGRRKNYQPQRQKHTALFYERVLSDLLGKEVKPMIIATRVTGRKGPRDQMIFANHHIFGLVG